MKSLLNAVTFSWDAYFNAIFGGAETDAAQAAAQAVNIIETALWIIIGIVGLAAVIYAVYLGFNLARASEQGKRDEAKKHLITVIIAIVVTLVLVIFFLYLLPGILGAFHDVNLDAA
ncbi:MAG: hypothetical protein IJX25_03660 [Clostridia bacterium]|nr:hypothetical protein [Clostridia bacterium]MBQ8792167.1 hypothetical protein [Clostridia bacterium]